jgi:tetratricopeptide (TPR) repeat protein
VDQAELTRSLDRAYRLSRGDERAELGEIYLTLLVDLAEDAIAKGEPATAAEHYRQAESIARAIASDRLEQIERAAEELVEQVRLDQQIAQLERAVQANPANISAARDLVGLLMLEKLDAGRALAYVESTKDPDLIDVVTFAAGGVDAATPPEALRVGDWYFAAAQGADDEAAVKRLSRALDFYNRMLDAYPRDDALSQRVTTLRDQARLRLNQIRGTRSQAQPGQWTNLIETFDRDQHALGPDLAVRQGKLYSSETGFILGVAPQGAYILKMQLQYLEGHEGISLCLPVLDEHFTFQYSWMGHTRNHILGARRSNEREDMLRPGREVELEIRVTPMEDRACEIAVRLDDEPLLEWTGEIRFLNLDERLATPERFGPAIRVSCGGNIIFNTIQYLEPAEDE